MTCGEPGASGGVLSLADAYSILGLGRDATEGRVNTRFRELALMHHPDRGGNGQEFIRICWARKAILDHLGSWRGCAGGDDTWLSSLLDLAMRLIEHVSGQPWSALRKALAFALVCAGGALVAYALTDGSGGQGD